MAFVLASHNIDERFGTTWTCPLTSGKTKKEATSVSTFISGSFLDWVFDLAPEPLKQWYCKTAYLFRYIQYTFLGMVVNRTVILNNSFVALQEFLMLLNCFITQTLGIPANLPIHMVRWVNFDMVEGIISMVYLFAIPFVSMLVAKKVYTTFFRRFILRR